MLWKARGIAAPIENFSYFSDHYGLTILSPPPGGGVHQFLTCSRTGSAATFSVHFLRESAIVNRQWVADYWIA
jgi:hypothetical protein